MDTEGSLLRAQDPTTCPRPEPLTSSRRPTLCLKHTFQKYAPILRESVTPAWRSLSVRMEWTASTYGRLAS